MLCRLVKWRIDRVGVNQNILWVYEGTDAYVQTYKKEKIRSKTTLKIFMLS